EHLGVVEGAVIVQIERRVTHTIRQGLPPTLGRGDVPVLVGPDEVLYPFVLDRRPVDVEDAVDHLDSVIRKTNDSLDVVDRTVLRTAKDGNIAALGLRCEDPSGKQRRRKRQRIAAVSIAELGYEHVVADQKRRHHRLARDIERLEQEDPDVERYQQ